MGTLEIRLCGGLEVRRGGAAVALPPSRKTRALLAYLAATGREHTREHLCALLWDGPDDPRAALRWSLSKLRPLVDDDDVARLSTGGERVGLDVAGVWVDWRWLRGVDAAAPAAQLARAAELACGALAEGLDLPEHAGFTAWLASEREAARRERRRLLAAAVAARAGDDAVAWALRWVAAEPVDEAAHVAAMRALAAAGRIDDALAQYARAVDALGRELGARPSAELERERMALVRGRGGAASVGAPAVIEATAARATIDEATARAAIEAAASGAPAGPPALIGRAAELAAIAAWWGSGAPALGLVGEPGIGKSSLLAVAAARARADGAGVLVARPFELEHVRPFGVWRDLVASLAPDEVPASLRAELAALAPGLGPAPERVDAAHLDAALVALIAHLAAARPVVLVVDDWQWCDERSAAVVLAAVRAIGAGRLRVAAAARPGELAGNAAAARAWQALARRGELTEVAVAPLAADALATLVAGVDAALDADAIAASAGGNPLYALEAARAVAAGGEAGDSFDAIVAERVDRLGAAARELVPWAAAAGRRFRAGWLGRAAEVPAAALAQALAELEAHALVRDAGDDDYELAHDLVRDAAYRALRGPRRRFVHGRLAAALADLDGDAAAIAHHAGLAGDHALAARACTDAAAACVQVAAFADARALVARGLDHAAHLAGAAHAARCIALLAVDVHCAGGGEAAPELAAALLRHIDAARAAGDDAAATRGLYALSKLHHDGGDFAAAIATSRALVEAGRGTSVDTELFALANGAMCSLLVQRDLPRARAHAADALALARARRTYVCDLELSRGMLARLDGDDAASEAFGRAIARARAEHDTWREHLALGMAMAHAIELGEPAAALAHVAAAVAVAERLPAGSELAYVRALEAVAHLAAGTGAVAAVDAALAALRALDAQRAVETVQALTAELDLAAGRAADARARADEAWRAARTVALAVDAAVAGALRARAAAATGALADARAALADATDACPAPPPRVVAALARAGAAITAAEAAAEAAAAVTTPPPTPPPTPRRQRRS